MHGLRWILSAGTGAVIGIAAAVALDLSYRLLHRQHAAPVPTAPRSDVASRLPHVDPQGWPVKATIVAVAVAAYTLVGYDYRPIAPPPPAEPVAATTPEPTLDSGPVSFAIGGTDIAFAPPAGSCLYPAPLLEAIKVQQEKLNPDNMIDTAFADCSELRDTVANQARVVDFGILMTPKSDATRHVDRAAIEAMAAATPDASSDPNGVKEPLDQRLTGAQSKLALQSFSSLGVVDRDPQAVYFAYLSRAQGADGEYMQACVMAMTATKGRLVSYYLYSDYAKDPRSAIFNLLQKAKAGATDLQQRNRS